MVWLDIINSWLKYHKAIFSSQSLDASKTHAKNINEKKFSTYFNYKIMANHMPDAYTSNKNEEKNMRRFEKKMILKKDFYT